MDKESLKTWQVLLCSEHKAVTQSVFYTRRPARCPLDVPEADIISFERRQSCDAILRLPEDQAWHFKMIFGQEGMLTTPRDLWPQASAPRYEQSIARSAVSLRRVSRPA